MPTVAPGVVVVGGVASGGSALRGDYLAYDNFK